MYFIQSLYYLNKFYGDNSGSKIWGLQDEPKYEAKSEDFPDIIELEDKFILRQGDIYYAQIIDSSHISTVPVAKISKMPQSVVGSTDAELLHGFFVIRHNDLLSYCFSETNGWVASELNRTKYISIDACPKYIPILGMPKGLRAEKIRTSNYVGYAPIDPKLGCVFNYEFYAKIIKIN